MILSLDHCASRQVRSHNAVYSSSIHSWKSKFTVKTTPKTLSYGEFDREFGFVSHEWSCSNTSFAGLDFLDPANEVMVVMMWVYTMSHPGF